MASSAVLNPHWLRSDILCDQLLSTTSQFGCFRRYHEMPRLDLRLRDGSHDEQAGVPDLHCCFSPGIDLEIKHLADVY